MFSKIFIGVELDELIRMPGREKQSRLGHQVQSGKELMMCPDQIFSAKETGSVFGQRTKETQPIQNSYKY